ncbi:hypothetical protein [Halodesulfovibrio aestuarii]|uniref:hypothetical protein n=1 Tax=Halodesulfovibrio aestuarii TaxID=126333 RepID=UPI00041806DF
MRKLLPLILILFSFQTTYGGQQIGPCSPEALVKAQKQFSEKDEIGQYGIANLILEEKYAQCPILAKTFEYKGANRTTKQQKEQNIHNWFMHHLMLSRFHAEKYEKCLELGELMVEQYPKNEPKELFDSMKAILAACHKAASRNCSDTALRNGLFWKVDSEALYRFTQGIVDAVENKDLAAFRTHIKSELSRGLRNRYMDGKTFSEVFTDDFRDTILEYGPTCYVHSWRGVAMGRGEIWITPLSSNEFTIRSVWKYVPEKFYAADLPAGWVIDGKMLTPDRLSRPGISNEYYEYIAKQFSITPKEDFLRNTGKYLSSLPLVKISARREDLTPSLINPATPTPAFNHVETKEKTVRFEQEKDIYTLREEYTLLAEIPSEICQSLAPDFKGTCLQSYLIELGEDTGGTMGMLTNDSIYGLFRMPDKNKIIAPLVHFSSSNDAKNYLEDMNIAPLQQQNK